MIDSNDPPAPPFFELRDLRFSYSAAGEAVRGVSFQIRRGEMVGIIGPNGAGKSTLLGLMNGLLDPSGGEVLIEGAPLAALSPMQRALRIGFVPQTPRVFFPYSVAEIVAMGRHPFASPFGGLSEHDRERVHWAMEVTGVGPFAGRAFNQLSGGEAQRVVLARALAQDAPALLLDEPTSSLDLYYQTVLYGLLERMNRDHGLTVVTVTHDINLAAEYCPRMIGVREGRVAMDGAPEEILTSEKIRELYGVQAEIVTGGGGRLVRVRHFGPENSDATHLAPSDPSPAPRPGAN